MYLGILTVIFVMTEHIHVLRIDLFAPKFIEHDNYNEHHQFMLNEDDEEYSYYVFLRVVYMEPSVTESWLRKIY